MASGQGLLSAEVKRLIVIAVVSFAAQFVGWISGATVITDPIIKDVAKLERTQKELSRELDLHEKGSHPLTQAQMGSMEKDLTTVKDNVEWMRRNWGQVTRR